MHRMTFVACVVLGLVGAAPTLVQAQIEFSPRFGFHVDHPHRSEYAIVYRYTPHLDTGDTWEVGEPATVPAYGGRVDFAIHPNFRLQFDAMFSKNTNSSTVIINTEPPLGTIPLDSAFEVHYRYLALRVALDLFANAPVNVRIAFGPAWMHSSGNGQLLLPSANTAGYGGAVTGLVHLLPHLNLTVDASLSAFRRGDSFFEGRPPPGNGGNTRHDIHMLMGLNWVLGHPLAKGRPSMGPAYVPKSP